MRLPSVLVLVQCLIPLLVWADPDLVKLGRLFLSIPSGEKGSCMNRDVQGVYTDAKTHLTDAIKALSVLIRGRVDDDDYGRNMMNLASAYFGISYNSNDKCTLKITEKKSSLKILKQALVGGTSEMSKKWKLECTDDDLEWATTLGDLGNKTHPQDSLIDALKKAGKKDYSKKKGLYIAKNLSPKTSDGVYEYQNAVYATGGDQAGPNVEYCASTGRSPNGQGKKVATAYRPSKLLVLCEKFFTWRTIAKAEELAE
ncbi:hypothetical protein NUU61_007681 [Penicillium alfredii]|uniref:Uncharacterized protein n=1 Tax=Penicillium alfredii TaxID=1506179 RepID=A0A9W9ER46_9EURO|nr:uncharacterized protein NUU61_007681 [Penicillium alfredii]KAJ5086374.1 hypothetical protein NUU61_007681 [Penicillium alfredii]